MTVCALRVEGKQVPNRYACPFSIRSEFERGRSGQVFRSIMFGAGYFIPPPPSKCFLTALACFSNFMVENIFRITVTDSCLK